jgi:hypothetical protein
VPTKQALLPDKAFALIVNFYLGISLPRQNPDDNAPCSKCHSVLTPDGSHAAICGKGDYSRNNKHTVLKTALYDVLRDCNVAARLDTRLPHDESELRPADVYAPTLLDGRGVAIDVSVVSPFPSNIIGEAAARQGAAAAAMEERKVQRYDAHCRALNILYRPWVIELFGGFGTAAKRLLDSIAHRYALVHEIDPSTAATRIAMRLSIALVRYTAAMLAECHRFLPPDRDLRVIV